ncbi:MAG TPA: hypothetical protein VNL16_17610 [Chloroflexota bacterium]|nr:hypothetical protein [Chloroflexota bacterium]
MSWGSPRSRAAFPGREPFWRDRQQFLRELPDGVRGLLPAELRDFTTRARGGLTQLYYQDPSVHFEAWFHWKTNRLELGLHFEKSARDNERLFDAFDRRIVEIKCELGESIDLERWEKGWVRLYETWPCEKVDRSFQDQLTERLARIIAVLQPMLDEFE